MEEAPPAAVATIDEGEEWRLKYLKEVKVNQELGRRLRETKNELALEKAKNEDLQQQLAMQNKTLTNQVEDALQNAREQCFKCSELEARLAQLEGSTKTAPSTPEEYVETDKPQDTPHSVTPVPSSDTDSEKRALVSRRSNSILVRVESGGIHPLQDILDGLHTTKADGAESAQQPTSPPQLKVSPPPQLQIPPPPAKFTGPRLSVSGTWRTLKSTTETESVASSANQGSNQDVEHHFDTLENFLGDSNSVTSMFKYSVLIAGPTRPRPKKNPFANIAWRFKSADFRRTRSLPEGQHGSDSIVPTPSPTAGSSSTHTNQPPGSMPSTPLAHLEASGRSSFSTSSEIMAEEGTPTKTASQRAAGGWWSSLSQRFRSGGSSPSGAGTPTPDGHVRPPPSPVSSKIPEGSRILHMHPSNAADIKELEGLPELCFPYSERKTGTSAGSAIDYSRMMLKRVLQERHRAYRSADSSFVLTLSSQTSADEILYAVCLLCPTNSDEEAYAFDEALALAAADVSPSHAAATPPGAASVLPTQCCLCLVSKYPFFNLFFKVLFSVAATWDARRKAAMVALVEWRDRKDAKKGTTPPKPLTIADLTELFHSMTLRLKDIEVPTMGSWRRIVLDADLPPLSFHRPNYSSEQVERRTSVLEYAAPTLFALLSVDQILLLLGCLCSERKVLVVSDHVYIVSAVVLALTSLLDPLQWAGPVVTVLPPRMDELLDAPVPLIAGRVASLSTLATANGAAAAGFNSTFSTLTKPMNGVIEINVDLNNLCMHEDDLVNYHELKLPGCDALVHTLAPHAALLFDHDTRDPDFPTIQQTEACEIMCARIKSHMEAICALATGETQTLDLLYATPRATTTSPRNAQGKSLPCFAVPLSSRRGSDLVNDYIERFQGTQMFSMYVALRQDEHAEMESVNEEHYEDHPEGHEDDDEGDEEDYKAATCDPETIFESETINYEPDALASS